MDKLEIRFIEDPQYSINQNKYGKFVVQPLVRGQGITLGNALRRVLLSGLTGTAVTSVRIAGVSHEFSTVPGVREDVLDILLNMKELVLRGHTDEMQIGRLYAKGPLVVTSKYFDLPSEVDVVDSTQYIATVADGATLEMEFTIERGQGYNPNVVVKDDASSVDFLQIDTVFMPVRKVSYSVEDIRSLDEVSGAEKLFIELWTDGSLSPTEALSDASKILIDLFEPFRNFTLEPTSDDRKENQDPTNQILIEELQLSVRAYNCLKRAQVNTIADLLHYTQQDLLEIKNFGQKSAEEVTEALQRRLGITLPTEKISKAI